MPGIPRSKGCVVCRERKVKCDLNRPTCKRCIESGRTCKGYRKQPTLFVNSSSASGPHHNTSNTTRQPSAGPVLIDHVLALFLHNYLPTSHNQITHNHQYGLSWAQYMPGICNKSQVLMQSLAAVSLALVGRSNGDEKLIKSSFEVYGAALKGLRGVLRKETNGEHTQDTLASMMAMTTYEMWQPTFKSGHGWMAHVQGASRIMQKLGPVSTQTPLDACLLSHFRTSSIFDALGRRKPYLWNRNNWKQGRTEAPKLNHLLLDILADIPALFEKTDLLLEKEKQEPEFTLQRIDMMQKYTAVNEQLQTWYDTVEEANPKPLYRDATKEDDIDEIEYSPFESTIVFSSLPMAQLVLIYWTCRSMLYAEMDRLTSAYKSPQPHFSLLNSTPTKSSNPYIASSFELADLALRGEPYCTHKSHGMSGVQSVAFTLWALQHHVYFNRSTEKEEYCDNRALDIGRSRGLYFLSQVTNLSCDDYKEMGQKGLKLEVQDSGIHYFERTSLEKFEYGNCAIDT